MGFWCGFCVEVVTLKKSGLKAWDERFDHIDDNHFKKEQTIDQWFPINEDLPIGMLSDGRLLEGGEPPAQEVNSDDEEQTAAETMADAEQDRNDGSNSSSNSSGDESEAGSPNQTDDTSPSMLSELQRPTLPKAAETQSISASSHKSNQSLTRKVWFCVSRAYPDHSVQLSFLVLKGANKISYSASVPMDLKARCKLYAICFPVDTGSATTVSLYDFRISLRNRRTTMVLWRNDCIVITRTDFDDG